MKLAIRMPLLLGALIALAVPLRAAHAQDEMPFEPPPPPPEDDVEAVPPSAEPPPRAPDQRTFEQQLSPYGRWVDTPEYGRVWMPAGVGPDWQPYSDGRWVNTAWRWVNGYACWSPLGPRGYVYGRRWPGWVVVPYAHFTHPIRRWAVPSAQNRLIVRSAHPVRSFPTLHARHFEGHGGARRGHAGRR